MATSHKCKIYNSWKNNGTKIFWYYALCVIKSLQNFGKFYAKIQWTCTYKNRPKTDLMTDRSIICLLQSIHEYHMINKLPQFQTEQHVVLLGLTPAGL